MKQLDRVEIGKMRQLADFLETVPPNDFDLRVWEKRAARSRRVALFGLIERDPGCGFAGCAVGWAAYSGLFPGLTMSMNTKDYKVAAREPVYRGQTNWAAVMRLLGLSKNFTHFLFSGDFYKTRATPGMVADRLRAAADRIESLRTRGSVPKLRLVA